MDGGRRSRRRRGKGRRVDWIKLVEKAIHLPGAHPIRQIVRFRINPMLEQNGTWIRDKSAAQFRTAPSLCNEVGQCHHFRLTPDEFSKPVEVLLPTMHSARSPGPFVIRLVHALASPA
jgi:hypothetical protein